MINVEWNIFDSTSFSRDKKKTVDQTLIALNSGKNISS